MFGIVTPIWFTVSSLWVKHLTSKDGGQFEVYTLTFTSSMLGNGIIQIVAVSWYWQYVAEFDRNLFLIGMLTSMMDVLGMSFINDALSNGPCGPVQAYVMLTNVGFVIFEAIRLL